MLTFRVQSDGMAPLKAALARGAEKAEQAVAIQAAADTRPFVPAKTLSLANRTIVRGKLIIYPGPYARYLYHGKLMVSPTTGSSYAKKGETKELTDVDLKFDKTVHKLAQAHWFEASRGKNIGKWLRVAGRAVNDELK